MNKKGADCREKNKMHTRIQVTVDMQMCPKVQTTQQKTIATNWNGSSGGNGTWLTKMNE